MSRAELCRMCAVKPPRARPGGRRGSSTSRSRSRRERGRREPRPRRSGRSCSGASGRGAGPDRCATGPPRAPPRPARRARAFRSAAIRWTTSTSRSSRSRFTSYGTCPGSSAASVPLPRRVDERERAVVAHRLDHLERRAEVVLRLAREPDDDVGPEREVRDRVTQPRDEPQIPLRVVRPAHRLEDARLDPDWSGRWTCSHTASHSAIAAITGSRKSFGCGLVKRIRSIPSTASQARRSSPNSVRIAGARSRPQEFTFWPSSVTSRTPVSASCVTSATISPGRRLTSRPRTDGTMQ